jgi:polar amino acid transport system substrate-binding protein
MTKSFARPVAAAIVTAVLAGCTSTAAPASQSTAASAAPSASASAAQSAAPSASASAAQAQTLHPGVLTVVLPDFPYPGYIEGQDPTAPTGGYYVSMVNEIAKRLGVTPKFDKVDFTAMISGQFKDYDISVDSFSITPERQQKFNMTVPVISYYEGIMTKAGVKVATKEDVQNLVLGACGTCNLFKYIQEKIKPNKEPRAFDQDISKYDAVATGQIDGALGDLPVILSKTKDPKYAGTVAACKFQPAVDNAWILPKDSKISDQVSEIISAMKADGTLAAWEKQYVTPLAGGQDPNAVPDCPSFG